MLDDVSWWMLQQTSSLPSFLEHQKELKARKRKQQQQQQQVCLESLTLVFVAVLVYLHLKKAIVLHQNDLEYASYLCQYDYLHLYLAHGCYIILHTSKHTSVNLHVLKEWRVWCYIVGAIVSKLWCFN